MHRPHLEGSSATGEGEEEGGGGEEEKKKKKKKKKEEEEEEEEEKKMEEEEEVEEEEEEEEEKVTVFTTRFNICKFYVLPIQNIYIFYMDLRTSSDYFPIQN